MELRQLRYFLRTAETLSFSEAARKLYISQSTLSEQISKLEEELGAPLFLRKSHRISLTETGTRLVELARTTMDHADRCLNINKEKDGDISGELFIGVTYSFSTILTETLTAFVQQCPKVKLHVRYATNEELSRMLQRREIDLALAYQNHRHSNVNSEILFTDNLCTIVRWDHPLAQRKSVTIDDLKRLQLALPTDLLISRQVLDKELARTNTTLPYHMEISDANFLLEVVERGKFVTVLAGGTIHMHTSLKSILLDFPNNNVQACIHTLKDNYKKRSCQILIDLLRNSERVRLIRTKHPIYR